MRIHGLVAATVLAGSIVVLSSSLSLAQKGENHGGGGGGGSHSGGGGGGQSRPAQPPRQESRPAPPQPVVHAQRETVRTPTFVTRTNPTPAPRQTPPRETPPRETPPADHANPIRSKTFQPGPAPARRQIVASAPAVRNARTFTKTAAGRSYDNGLRLRKGIAVTASWEKHYFPKGHAHFPYYRQSYVRGQCYRSPFGFFFGVCVPYIGIADCRIFPPSTVFIDLPVFNGNECTGFADEADDNLFNDPTINDEQPGLLNAIDLLTETFQGGNIDGLVSLIDPNTSIAIYQSGKYQYSLPANDYIDLARDAIKSMNTVQFSLTYLHQRGPGVFSVSGKQTYHDQNGALLTTWNSFVLQDISGQWTLTQAGTAPGRR